VHWHRKIFYVEENVIDRNVTATLVSVPKQNFRTASLYVSSSVCVTVILITQHISLVAVTEFWREYFDIRARK